MSKVLWGLQILTAIFFFLVGILKVITPIDQLGEQMVWVQDVSPTLVRLIGVAEVAGGLGLVLPAATRILPWLTPLAAALLALDMVLATVFHITRNEFGSMLLTIILGVLVGLVAYGRWKRAPIQARGEDIPAVATSE